MHFKRDNEMIKKVDQSKTVFIVINMVQSLVFLWLNIITPLSGDDLIYQTIYGTGTRIRSFHDIIQSQINHYRMWGGRSVVHFIDQAFMLVDKSWFNIANTIVFLLFALLIYYYSQEKKVSNSFLLLDYIFLWCTIPSPINTIVWQTSSVNYLWGSTFILLYLLPYYKSWEAPGVKSKSFSSLLQAIIMFIFGILCGWTIEAGAVMLMTFIFVTLIYQIKKKKFIHGWKITGFIGSLVEFCILIFAPGNFNRANVVNQMTPDRSLFGELFFRIARETYYMLIHMWPLFVVLTILVIYNIKRKTGKTFGKMLLFVCIAFVGVYAMTASPAYAERVLITPIAFTVIGIGNIYDIEDMRRL